MDKQRIISEIQRLAKERGGKPIGAASFEQETGIKRADWYPDYWLRWGDAQSEAGVAKSQFQTKTDDEFALMQYIALIRELGHIPIWGELRRKARQDESFPSHQVFDRFGGKAKLVATVAEFCNGKTDYEDILSICEAHPRESDNGPTNGRDKRKYATGCVYLAKSGRHYKIGFTKSIGRRGGELALTIPIPPKTIHVIETDDPSGVEAYWHRRFADKRGEGEWFELTPDDVKAFKRWKRIV